MGKSASTPATPDYVGAAQATAAGNRVSQNTPYGSLKYEQTGTDSQGNPIWTATQTLPQGLENAYQGILGQVSNQYGQAFNPQLPSVGINPGETYSDAIMRRLQPQMEQSAQSQQAALANQGIVPGTVAYDNAMRTFNQQQNDLLTSAQIQGMNTGLQAQSLLGSQAGQVKNLTTPSFINAPQQAAATGPDYMGALQTQTNANIAAQNAALGQSTAQTAGLYGLGSAGLMGLAANPGLVTGGLSALGSGLSGAYNGIKGFFNSPTDVSNISTADWMSGNF